MKPKVYKMTLQVIDFEGTSEEDIISTIENSKYFCVNVKDICSREIGEWNDDHPLNKKDTCDQAFKDLFKE